MSFHPHLRRTLATVLAMLALGLLVSGCVTRIEPYSPPVLDGPEVARPRSSS